MIDSNKIESYMINLGLTFEQLDDSTWVINDEDEGLSQIVVRYEDPLVIISVNVMDVSANKLELYEELLSLNASDLVHGAYAVSDGKVILIDTLEAHTMDLEEFQASLDAIGLALAQHYKILSKYR